jgi:hypothetical protein
MEDAAFAALTLGPILANSIGHEPETRQSREASRGGTWHMGCELAARGARVAADRVGLTSAAIAGLISLSPRLGQVVRGAFRQPGARSVAEFCGYCGRALMLKRRLTRSC